MSENHIEKEMPFLEHLEELRWIIVRSLIGLAVGMVLCFIFAQYIIEFLTYPTTLLKTPFTMQILKVQGKLTAYFEIGFFGGLILALPYILLNIWRFISPGLQKSERIYVYPLLIFGTLLFLSGVAFAYRIILPFTLEFMIGLPPYNIEANFALDFYIGFVIRLMLIFGIVFDLPVLSYYLAKIGLINTQLMKTYRRHAIVAIFVLAALLTPPDPMTQVLMGLPLVFLYELSIGVVWRVEKNRKKEALKQESEAENI